MDQRKKREVESKMALTGGARLPLGKEWHNGADRWNWKSRKRSRSTGEGSEGFAWKTIEEIRKLGEGARYHFKIQFKKKNS